MVPERRVRAAGISVREQVRSADEGSGQLPRRGKDGEDLPGVCELPPATAIVLVAYF